MELTSAQIAAIKADILADPALNAFPNTDDGAFAIMEIYNAIAAPDFIVWRTHVTQDEIMQNGFDWVQVDNLSVGKARIWEWLFDNEQRVMNPSKDNVRAGIAECWKGTSAMLAVQAAVFSHCKRKASRIEKLLATGAGTDATPATMNYEGPVSYQEIRKARNS